MGESQPERGTWNRTAIPRRMERSAKEIAGCILAKVNGMGPQASFQQEASPGQHGHQRGSSPRHFRSHVLAPNMQASIKCRRSANGTVKLSRIRPFCGRILLDQRLRINDLAVAAGGENAAKLLNLTVSALLNRKLARQGGDPLAEKRRSQGIPTFAEAAARLLEQKRAGWRNPRHPREWMSSLRRFAFPRIGKMPVSEVTRADVLEILTPLWHRKAETARRVRQRLRAVLEWAVAMEFRIDNPCDRIGPVLGPQQDVTEHMQALPHREVAAVIRTVRASTALPAAKLALDFLVLTAARWGEVRWAEWEEIDRDGRVWTVPARRAKTNRRHRVPLCGRALEILEAAQALGEEAGPLVFTHGGGKPLHDSQLRRLLRELGIAAVPHGFRSTFRDWAGEETDHPREVIEAALAHVVRNRVEAAYARSDLFERRRVLMDDWARYLNGNEASP